MAWSPDDTRLASVGAGGACYQWDIHGGVKIAHEEYVDKQKNYCCVQFCSSSSSAYGVVVRSLDGKIQHIQVWAVLLLLQSQCYTCILSVLLFVTIPLVCTYSLTVSMITSTEVGVTKLASFLVVAELHALTGNVTLLYSAGSGGHVYIEALILCTLCCTQACLCCTLCHAVI